MKVGNDDISSKNKDEFHSPVLLAEVLSWLRCRPGGRYLDCTVGYGGLAERILESSGSDGTVVGIDRDLDAIAHTSARLRRFGARARLIHGNFGDLKQHLASLDYASVDGVVFDLGLSSAQLNRPERGFSFQVEGPLDMRMDQSAGWTAADVVAQLSEHQLADVIGRYGEERFARRIARAIVRAREHGPLNTTTDLASVIRQAVPASHRHGRIHVATRTFQALRIAVNRELDVLRGALEAAAHLLAPQGRLCVISFHSLEDRIAKQTLKALSQAPAALVNILTKKPQRPSEGEQQCNARARSAKLRVAERLPSPGYS